MNPPTTRRFASKLVLGLGLIILGSLLFLDHLGWPGAWILLQYWPLFLAAFGLARLAQRGWWHLGGHILIGLSLVLLAGQFGREELVERWWPLFLVWGGAVILLRALLRSPNPSVSCDPGTVLPRDPHEPRS